MKGGWVIAFDGEHHRLINNGEVAYEQDKIVYVGKNFEEKPDKVIDCSGQLISPGFINIHALSSICITHFRVDGEGKGGGLLNKEQILNRILSPIPYLKGRDLEVSSLFSFVELLKGGATTICEITAFGTTGFQPPREQPEQFAKTVDTLGARAYLSHPFTDAKKFKNEKGETEYYFDHDSGMKAFHDALDFNKKHEGTQNDRVRTMLFPYMFDACSASLLAETREKANFYGYPIHMHTAQYLEEYYESIRRYGKTPVHFLYDSGFLGSKTILTHLLYTSLNPVSPAPGLSLGNMRDVNMLAEKGATLGHTPIIWARIGLVLNSYAKFRDAGVNIGIGTDAWPMDMIMEMRHAILAGKIVDRSRTSVTARDVYNAATLGGAKALCRSDLGRLAPGAKADIIVVDLSGFHIALIDDPIKSMVYFGNQNDIDTVIVDGRMVVQDGEIPGIDLDKLAIEANKVNQRWKENFGLEYPTTFNEY
jgi:cytosine/adenosine deaminase-related metal-dependent hydrolase